jgi:hypothetical protein
VGDVITGGLFAMLWILLIWGILGSIFGYIFEYVSRLETIYMSSCCHETGALVPC